MRKNLVLQAALREKNARKESRESVDVKDMAYPVLARCVRELRRQQFARLLDHTQVRAQASLDDITRLCDEAVQHGFASVTVNPAWVSYCARRVAGSKTLVNACVGFPLGATTAHVKVEEARDAVRNGAGEIDMVINVGALKSGFRDFVEKEIAAVVRAVNPVPVKVILETGYLTDAEKIAVCEMSMRSGAAFVKTSTGFSGSGATIGDVHLMREVVGTEMGVKAAGGVRSYARALEMLEAGASRIGTSSAMAILDEMPS